MMNKTNRPIAHDEHKTAMTPETRLRPYSVLPPGESL